MTSISIIQDAVPQKFAFANPARTMVAVVDIHEIIDVGTPVDPEGGDDLQFIGITTSDVANGCYGETYQPFTLVEPRSIYACFYASMEEDGGRGDRGGVTHWVALTDQERQQLNEIAGFMEDKHLIENFTMLAGSPPSGDAAHSFACMIDDLAGTAITILEQGNDLAQQEWEEVDEYFHPHTDKLTKAITTNFSEEEQP